MQSTIFPYGRKETDYLAAKDKRLAKLIGLVGPIRRTVQPDPFHGLLRSIIGQQISSAAQATIWKRLLAALAPLTPGGIASQTLEALQALGISFRKAGYIRDIAASFASGELDGASLAALDDQHLTETLVRLRGVGQWTAEMLLIFTFQRTNILSFGDLAIQRGLRMLHRHKEITPALFSRYQARYAPYSTIASFYLWELASGKYPGYVDPLARPQKPEPKTGIAQARPGKKVPGLDR